VSLRYPIGAFPGVMAAVAACALLACSTLPLRSADERAADAALAARVEAALIADETIYARHIDVVVDRGVVHLGGFVFSDEDFRMARRDAASVSGVKHVDMEMELMRGGVSGTSR
jgi:osmotically-inducible protein OsmY